MLNAPIDDEQDELDDMAWIKKNDQKYRSREYRALSDAAYRLYDQGLCFSNDQLTDGVILRDDLEMVKVGIKSSRIADHTEELCISKLWHRPGEGCSSPDCPVGRGIAVRDGWVIHDYFDLRPTREEVLERQRVYADRAQKAGLASGLSRRSVGTRTGTPDELTSSQQVDSVANLEVNLNGARGPTQNEPQTEREIEGETVRETIGTVEEQKDGLSLLTETSISPILADPADPVRMVYDSWISSLPEAIRHRRGFTENRKKAIRKGLKVASLADCIAAVRGWRWDPWEDRKLYWYEIKYCLEPDNLERFRDWENGIDRPTDNIRHLPRPSVTERYQTHVNRATGGEQP